MNTGQQREVAKRLFEHIDGRSTDRSPTEMHLSERDYLDPEQAAAEWAVLATRPAVVAAAGELPSAGDFRTTRLAGCRCCWPARTTGRYGPSATSAGIAARRWSARRWSARRRAPRRRSAARTTGGPTRWTARCGWSRTVRTASPS